MVCDVKNCSKDSMLQYEAFGSSRKKKVGICTYHWEKHCDGEDKFDIRTYFYPPRVDKEKR